MPAKVYQYYEVNNFPEWKIGEAFRTNHQDALFNGVDESPHSTITPVGLADFLPLRKYHVLHETFQKVRGRYKNERITEYVAEIEFHLFFHPDHNRLLIDASRNVSREFVDRLSKSEKSFNVSPRTIDLMKLGDDLKADVRGGWFGDLKVADVSTIGMFGPTVGESNEWGFYESVGKLKAIDIEFLSGDQKLLVKILSNRGIVHFQTLTEAQSLERILNIHFSLDKYEIEPAMEILKQPEEHLE